MNEIERYKRQLSVSGFDVNMQAKLKGSTALVAGIGGLGGTAAIYLAAAGIGKLLLVHEGVLEYSDLNRQILMTEECLGRSRVHKAEETIKNFNSQIEIEAFDAPIKEGLLKRIVPDADIVLDCRHNFPERRLINKACVEMGVPMIEAAMNDMEGYLFSVLYGKTACLNCIYPDDPVWDPYGFPVMGAVSGMLGTLAAIEAIKILTCFQKPLLNKILYFNLRDMEFKKFNTYKIKDCVICSGLSL